MLLCILYEIIIMSSCLEYISVDFLYNPLAVSKLRHLVIGEVIVKYMRLKMARLSSILLVRIQLLNNSHLSTVAIRITQLLLYCPRTPPVASTDDPGHTSVAFSFTRVGKGEYFSFRVN